MKKPNLPLLSTWLLTLCFPLFAAEPPIAVAVFDFQSPDEGIRDLGPKVSALIGANLSADPRLITVERAELDKALIEQELGLSGTIAPDSAAKIGHLTGARVLVTGRVIKAADETIIIAKVIGTETSRVFGTTAKSPPGASLGETAASLTKSIADVISQNVASLLAAPADSDDQIARIKAALKPGRLPTVSVHIPEQHFGRAVIDPAAETELALILQKCGFTVTDQKSKSRPDFAFEGEAFSEMGLRKGNLMSCKARLELKLRNLANGELVAVDRQVSVGIDLSEHIAAQAALKNAAREIAGRMLPKFANR
jgi:hypothetical protein